VARTLAEECSRVRRLGASQRGARVPGPSSWRQPPPAVSVTDLQLLEGAADVCAALMQGPSLSASWAKSIGDAGGTTLFGLANNRQQTCCATHQPHPALALFSVNPWQTGGTARSLQHGERHGRHHMNNWFPFFLHASARTQLS